MQLTVLFVSYVFILSYRQRILPNSTSPTPPRWLWAWSGDLLQPTECRWIYSIWHLCGLAWLSELLPSTWEKSCSQNEKIEQTWIFRTCWGQAQPTPAALSRAKAIDPWMKHKHLWFKLLSFGVVSNAPLVQQRLTNIAWNGLQRLESWDAVVFRDIPRDTI